MEVRVRASLTELKRPFTDTVLDYAVIPGGSTLIFETLMVEIDATNNPDPVSEDEPAPVVDEAERPTPETTTAPELPSTTNPGGAKNEEEEQALSDRLTRGPISMPTRLPDLPITGLQNAATAPAAVASQQPLPGAPTKRPEDEPGAVNGECRLLGPFALIVQAALGFLALSSLVFKRWRERPRRPIKIWFFDVSKQVVGSAVLHILNLLMSMFSAADFELAHKAQELSESFQNSKTNEVNPCSWYLINIAIDVSHLDIPWSISVLTTIDYYRYTHSNCTPAITTPWLLAHTFSPSARIDQVRSLWSTASRNMVDQAIIHLLHRTGLDEALCFLHHTASPLDRSGR